MKKIVFGLLILTFFGCTSEDVAKDETKSEVELDLDGVGYEFLSGSSDDEKVWKVLRYYRIESGDISTTTFSNWGLVDDEYQTDLLSPYGEQATDLGLVFENFEEGKGWFGITSCDFKVIKNVSTDKIELENNSGTLVFDDNGYNPYFLINFRDLVEIKVQPSGLKENETLTFNNVEYTGDFLQLGGNWKDNKVYEFPADVVLLYSPTE